MADASRPSAKATSVGSMAEGGCTDEHFVDKHRVQLIQRVSNIKGILDELLHENVIHDDSYVKIWALPTSQDMMRELFSGPLASSRGQGKEIFYKILKKHESYLISDLKKKETPVDTVTAEKVLVETLNDLSSEELDEFKLLTELEKDFPPIVRRQLKVANTHDTVELLLETFSDKCVELAQTVLRKMNRTDLVQRLSDSSSGTKEKQSPSLIQRVETLASVIELLLETLADLSDSELVRFVEVLLRETYSHIIVNWDFLMFKQVLKNQSILQLLKMTDRQDTVFLMVQTHGQQSVEMTKGILKKIGRTDLMQRLSDSRAALKKKHSVDERLPALIHKVATMRAVKELLSETLWDLSYEEFTKFKWLLQLTFFQRSLEIISWRRLQCIYEADRLVDLMVKICGQQSVEVTKDVFMDMKRTDLVQRLSETSSGLQAVGSSAEAFGVSTMEEEEHCVDEQWPALIQKVETIVAVIELLLETLADLSDLDFKVFKQVFQNQTKVYRGVSDIQRELLLMTDRQDTVFSMVQIYGQQRSVEATKEVLKEIKRTDLLQRLSDSSSGFKKKHSEKHSVDEHLPVLIHKVATMRAFKELLLETLRDLRYEELNEFKWLLQFTFFQRSLEDISWRKLLRSFGANQLVDVMVEKCGQHSVEVTKEIFTDMKRTDLVKRLPETSSGHQEKHCVEQCPALIQKVETMTSLIELLLETLADLSNKEFKKFKKVLLSETDFDTVSEIIAFNLPEIKDRRVIVFLMVQTEGQQSVETTKKVLKKIRRTDLVRRLLKGSSRYKQRHLDEQQSALIHKVATMTAVKHLLLETFNDLSNWEIEIFKAFLGWIINQNNFKDMGSPFRFTAHRAEMVDLMMQTYGQQSVQLTREVLKKMNRTDLMQRLSKPSSGLKEEHQSELIHKETTMTSLMENLLKTLHELSPGEFEKFKHVLQFTKMETGLPKIPGHQMEMADRVEIVELIVKLYRQQSVEVTIKVLKKIYREDLVEMLSKTSARLKEKQQLKSPQKEATMTSLMKKLLETLEELRFGELEEFKWFLQDMSMEEDLPKISRQRMETAGRHEIVKLMVECYGQQCVVKTREVFMRMKRTDLVEMLSEISSQSGYQGSSGRSELEGCVSTTQDPSDWTKLEPEVTSTDEDEAPTYSLQSGAGNFECSVSGLRWVCKEKVSFKYQFCSLDVPMERLEMMQYMPAGPLMNITVIAGKFDEVHLPHWICIDDNPTILDKFAVLHIDDCGDAVEKVSEVTSSHVKLSEPVFALKMVLVKLGLSVEIYCKVLIYYKMINAASSRMSLTLHVYLIPPDRGLQQHLDKTEMSDGYKVIRKNKPQKPLKMHDWFKLTTDLDGADIYPKGEEPQTIMLRYNSTDPDFYEVIKKNPDKDFKLTLTPKNGHQPVWTCEIQEGEYQNTGRSQAAVSATGPYDGAREKRSLDQQQEATMTSLIEKLLETLEELRFGELEEFKWFLQDMSMEEDLPKISRQRMETAGRHEIVKLMVERYGQQCVVKTREVFMKMNRTDLVKMLSEISSESGYQGSSGRSELEGCISTTQDSSDWTKLEPEVTSTDEDEAPTYSLQSGAGNFECSVSGLRWVCKEKVSFKYQFCSLDVPMERLEMMQYMPAGPLMNITVIAGKFDEVHLPHWICIDDNPTILDKFAVLHIDDCGDAVEKVSEVTSSHVKLSEPVFSLKMVLVKYFGLSVEIYCKVLIYYKMINAASSRMSLTLHVYLIPPDPGLQQHLDKTEIPDGYNVIRKNKPQKPLKMHDWFKLTTDLDGADIYPKGEEPQTIMLRYNSTDPDFYEVIKKNPDKDFKLTLTPKNGHQPVWTCEIQEGEYQNTGRSQAAVSATGSYDGARAREKRSVDQQQKAASTVNKARLLEILQDLNGSQFEVFKWHLKNGDIGAGLRRIQSSELENSNRLQLVDLMVHTYTQRSVEVAKKVLEEIGRNDLVQRLSDTSSRSEGKFWNWVYCVL